MQGYVIALLVGTPIGFFLGLSSVHKMFDPIFRYCVPSPLAWLPLGMVLFSAKANAPGTTGYTASDLAAIFTIASARCGPVLNTAVGVRAIRRTI